jgi:magnesium-protoporphyrin O-methyltransferase
MPACCGADAYAKLFDEKNARRDAERYRTKGLDTTGRRIVDEIARRGVAGASVLEVGGGIRALAIELVRSGAARAINVELVGTYEEAAGELIEAEGLAARFDRQVLDFAREPQRVASADIVVLHRVVCCYPDMESLVRASADHATELLALSFPAERWWWRMAKLIGNGWFRLRGCAFRIYLHDVGRILATAESTGLRPIYQRRGWVWHVVILERSSRTTNMTGRLGPSDGP